MLHGLDLDVPAGTTVALVGHTGAGKSTIAKLLARFYDPRGGRVTIDGHDLRDVTQASIRSQLGIVPQEGFLFSGTVAQNIAFGRPGASREQVEAAAAAVGADEFVAELPDGYDTELGERGFRLSLGQRQLVAFARALLADRASSSSTRRRRRSTSAPSGGSSAGSAGSWRDAPRSSSLTGSRRSGAPTSSSCSTTGGSWSTGRTSSSSPPAGRTPASTETGRRRSPEGVKL